MKQTAKYFKSILTAAVLILAVSAINAAAATFTVTNANDSGAGSLRDAISQANANGQADTINFDAAFFGTARTITLASEIQITADGANPGRSVTINGTGANLLTISGGNAVRPFYAMLNSSVSLSGLTLRDGNGVGSENFYDRLGGAMVCAQCSLTLSNVVVRNNSVTRDGGGIYVNNGSATISNSIFRENNADATGGALFVNSEAGRQLTITDSLVTENKAGSVGGIFAGGNMTKAFSHTTISSNVVFHRVGGAMIENGALTLANCQITENRAGVPNVAPSGGAASAGGLALSSGTANITDTVISNNIAGVSPADSPGGIIGLTGGVVVDTTTAVFRRVTVSNNTDYDQQTNRGAGMELRSVTGVPITIIDSLVSNNRHSTIGNGAAHGAGIATANTDGSISIINTTITGNVAEFGLGGGIYNFMNGLKIINSTITGNTSTFNDPSSNEDGGGGIYTFPNR